MKMNYLHMIIGNFGEILMIEILKISYFTELDPKKLIKYIVKKKNINNLKDNFSK